ncbi:MAG TPA: arsenate reductase (glutaredoxin) [Marinobacterium sp.]|nr:arsenate reductase (glutaredoxin) [Marinobacterium sp.]
MTVTILHNPRCSKSRQTLALLIEQGVEPEVREYLKQPLSRAELELLIAQLGIEAKELVRSKEDEFKQTDLELNSASATELIDAMVATPKLMERPVVISAKGARIGRPPERVLEIL